MLNGGLNDLLHKMEMEMKMETKKVTKHKKTLLIVMLGMFSILTLMPLVLAYPATLPAYDLYTVFVEAVFGGFWLSVFALALIMFIMLGPLGGLSQFTAMYYCGIFMYAMALGYTHPLILIPMWTALMGWTVFQFFKYLNSGSTA